MSLEKIKHFIGILFFIGSILFFQACVPKTPPKKVCPSGTVFNDDSEICVQEKQPSLAPIIVSATPTQGDSVLNVLTTDSTQINFEIQDTNFSNFTLGYKWTLFGPNIPTPVSIFDDKNFELTPSLNLTAQGSYTLLFQIVNASNTNDVFDSHQWVISVTDPGQSAPLVAPQASPALTVAYSQDPVSNWRKSGNIVLGPTERLSVTLQESTNREVRYYSDSKSTLIGTDTSAVTIGAPPTQTFRYDLEGAQSNFSFIHSNKAIIESRLIIAEVWDTLNNVQVGSDVIWPIQVAPYPLTSLEAPTGTPPAEPPYNTTVNVNDLQTAGSGNFQFTIRTSTLNNGSNGSDGASGLTCEFLFNGAVIVSDPAQSKKDMPTGSQNYTLTDYDPTIKIDLSQAPWGVSPSTPTSGTLEAIITDKYSGSEVGRVTWNLQISTAPLPNVLPADAKAQDLDDNPTPDLLASGTEISATNDKVAGDISWKLSNSPAITNVNPTIQISQAFNSAMGHNNHLGSDGVKGIKVQFYVNESTSISIGSDNYTLQPVYTTNDSGQSPVDTEISLNDAMLPVGAAPVSDFKFQLASNQIPSSSVIKAVVTDVYSNQEIRTYLWPVIIKPENTPPDISIVNPIANPVVIAQHPTNTTNFQILMSDLETATGNLKAFFEFEGTSITTTSHAGSTENCNGSVAGDDTCTFSFPAYDTNGPLPSGSLSLTAKVQDDHASPLTSSIITWNLSITEINTAPQVQPFVSGGEDITVAPNDTNSAIVNPASPNIAISSFSEGQTIRFRIRVQDAERDSFKVKVDAVVDGKTTNVLTFLDAAATVTSTNDSLTKEVTFDYVVPEGFWEAIITDAGITTDVQFTITAEDIPTSATPLTDVEIVPTPTYTLTNNNPLPTFSSAGVSPPLASQITTIVGTPISFSFDADGVGSLSDASTADDPDDDQITYQWQVKPDCTNVASVYENIDGASGDYTAGDLNLDWIPHDEMAGNYACIRLCLGDKGQGGDITTCPTSISWEQGPNQFANIAPSNSDLSAGNLASANSKVSTWHRANGGVREVYTVVVTGSSSQFTIHKRQYDNQGNISTPTVSQTLNASSSTPGNDIIDEISITGDSGNNKLYIALKIQDPDSGPKPDLRIHCLLMATLASCSGNEAVRSLDETDTIVMGDIVIGGDISNWILPIIDGGNSNSVSLLHLDVNNTAAATSFALGDLKTLNSAVVTPGFTLKSAVNNDPADDMLYLLITDFSLSANLFGIDIDAPAAIVDGAGVKGTTKTNIFNVTTVNHSLAVGHANGTDRAVYATGINSSGDVIATQFDLTNPNQDDFSGADTIGTFTAVSLSTDPVQAKIIPSSSDETNTAYLVLLERTSKNFRLGRIDFAAAPSPTLNLGTRPLNSLGTIHDESDAKQFHLFPEMVQNLTSDNRDFLIFSYIEADAGGPDGSVPLMLINAEEVSVPNMPYTVDDASSPKNWAIPYLTP